MSWRARPRRGPPLPDRRVRAALALPLAMVGLAAGLTGALAASPADDYTNAVLRTLTFVRFAEKGDQPSVPQAIMALEPIGASQPDIVADLKRSPPDLADADARLASLLDALRGRADVADPLGSQAALHRILAMPRYAGLTTAAPWWQQALGWVLQQLARLLTLIGAGHLVIPPLGFLVAAAAVLLLIAAWLVRALTSRVAPDRRRPGSARASAPTDDVALADRQASAGDYTAALRALTAGVASRLNGERVWVSSPLTVREIFQGAPVPQSLSPLLRAFEEAFYGHRPPDVRTYTGAAAAAEPYRGVTA